eukprot:CAMPEP_0170512634 /NCGR_PEP_ID=MMETSP0208-20121228/66957_1 /TAXON_ID=197538 /ORGANISM="Strombidium inclinatum, Strain S3" /LENGTH=129 /DNA_ID=CAMNT_0010796283 /DNA_START=1324 /DNA_END=1710 /DNA_ORIENTATION=+
MAKTLVPFLFKPKVEKEVKISLEPMLMQDFVPSTFIDLTVYYPPTQLLKFEYNTVTDLLSDVGSIFSLLKVFATAMISNYIFKEFNNSMARHLFNSKYPEFEGSRREKKGKIAELEAEFRDRVSQESLY